MLDEPKKVRRSWLFAVGLLCAGVLASSVGGGLVVAFNRIQRGVTEKKPASSSTPFPRTPARRLYLLGELDAGRRLEYWLVPGKLPVIIVPPPPDGSQPLHGDVLPEDLSRNPF